MGRLHEQSDNAGQQQQIGDRRVGDDRQETRTCVRRIFAHGCSLELQAHCAIAQLHHAAICLGQQVGHVGRHEIDHVLLRRFAGG
jgi:hypothetical protein